MKISLAWLASVLALLAAVVSVVQAQQAPAPLGVAGPAPSASSTSYRPNDYYPVYAPSNSYGGGGGGYWGWGGGGGGTAASASMHGMASIINAAGQANLANSAAANNWESAYSMDLNNRLQYTSTYFEQRRINREARAAERPPRVTEEELTRFAKEAAPARLTASQLDPVTGEIAWPAALQDRRYAAARERVDQLFSAREANAGAIGAAGYRNIRDAIDNLRAEFARNISDYAPQVYIEGRKFLDSLDYESRFAS